MISVNQLKNLIDYIVYALLPFCDNSKNLEDFFIKGEKMTVQAVEKNIRRPIKCCAKS